MPDAVYVKARVLGYGVVLVDLDGFTASVMLPPQRIAASSTLMKTRLELRRPPSPVDTVNAFFSCFFILPSEISQRYDSKEE